VTKSQVAAEVQLKLPNQPEDLEIMEDDQAMM
jgi:hypothetical protein